MIYVDESYKTETQIGRLTLESTNLMMLFMLAKCF